VETTFDYLRLCAALHKRKYVAMSVMLSRFTKTPLHRTGACIDGHITCILWLISNSLQGVSQMFGERYANHILWMAFWWMILTVWDSTRKKIGRGGVVLYRSR
jgi:hypothetical protein